MTARTDNVILPGLTKREYFAIRAFQGILSRQGIHGATSDAQTAVEFADALMQALDGEEAAAAKSEWDLSDGPSNRIEFLKTGKI